MAKHSSIFNIKMCIKPNSKLVSSVNKKAEEVDQ